jgi:hypothetical protein
MSTARKQLYMYCSRKRSMPQRSQWPLVFMKTHFFCFAHLKLQGKCKTCSFDVCKEHAKLQAQCSLCKTNKHDVNVPCGKHRIEIGDCASCTGSAGFLSFDSWKLCNRHLQQKKGTKLTKSKSMTEHTHFRQDILQCLLCINSNESLASRQKRNSFLVQPLQDAVSRPRKRVKHNDTEINGDNKFNKDKPNGTGSSGNIN